MPCKAEKDEKIRVGNADPVFLCCVLFIFANDLAFIQTDIYHGGLDITMAHKFCNSLNIHPSFGEIGSKCTTKPVRVNICDLCICTNSF